MASKDLAALIVPITTIAVSIVMFIGAMALPPARFEPMGPAGLPYIIATALLLLGIADLIQLRRTRMPSPDNTDTSGTRTLIFGTCTILGYVLLLQSGVMGFVTASALFLIAMGLALSRDLKREMIVIGFVAVIISIGVALLLTRVLVVVLPGSGALF